MAPASENPTAESPTPNVLVVGGDSKETERLGALAREWFGCRVDNTDSVEGAKGLIGSGSYSLVILDSPRPGGEALALVERARQVSPTTGVIILSEASEIEDAVAAVKLGADDYLAKPVGHDRLRLSIRKALDRKTVYEREPGIAGLMNLVAACQLIAAATDRARIVSAIASFFKTELRSDHAAVFLADGTRVDEPDRPDRGIDAVLDIALRSRIPFDEMKSKGQDSRFFEPTQLNPEIFVYRFSLSPAEELFCVVLAPAPPASSEGFSGRMRVLGTQVDLASRNLQQFGTGHGLAFLDDVTGLHNARFLGSAIERAIREAGKEGASFAVLFIDVDRFKKVNDRYGHAAGNRVLAGVASRIRELVRGSDAVVRYGGDEFVCVISPCDSARARAAAARIREAISLDRIEVAPGTTIGVSVSIGVALYPAHGADKDSLLDAADRAMYRAKSAKRGSVFMAKER